MMRLKQFVIFRIWPAAKRSPSFSGGWDDFWGWADSEDQAVEMVRQQGTHQMHVDGCLYQIVDLHRGVVVKNMASVQIELERSSDAG